MASLAMLLLPPPTHNAHNARTVCVALKSPVRRWRGKRAMMASSCCLKPMSSSLSASSSTCVAGSHGGGAGVCVCVCACVVCVCACACVCVVGVMSCCVVSTGGCVAAS
jgi:hypothetical protein